MVKLPNIFGGNTIYLTQSPHGANQNYKAIDVLPKDLITPFDGCKTSITYGTGGGRWFNLTLPDGSIIQCVHGVPTRQNSEFKKGEIFGKAVPYSNGDHWHIAIRVAGIWRVILDYIDQTNNIELVGNFKSQHWKNWSTWQDLYLDIKQKNMPTFDTNHEEVKKAIERDKVELGLFSNYSDDNLSKPMNNATWLVMMYRFLDKTKGKDVDVDALVTKVLMKLDPKQLASVIAKYLPTQSVEVTDEMMQKILMKLDPDSLAKVLAKYLPKYMTTGDVDNIVKQVIEVIKSKL
jgi:hypothetical protein